MCNETTWTLSDPTFTESHHHCQNNENNNNNEDKVDLLQLLPLEILHNILWFVDVPTLGILATTSKPKEEPYLSISHIASNNFVWLNLVQRRFRVLQNPSMRITHQPMPFGGPTWKMAYQAMSHSHRIPRTRLTPKRRAVFAKGGASKCALPSSNNCGKNTNKMNANNFVNLWVMVGHTNDCNTRTDTTTPSTIINQQTPSSWNSDSNRYIELHLCIQNIKSGFGTVDVELNGAFVQTLASGGPEAIWTTHVEGALSSHRRRRPRLLFKSRGDHEHDNYETRMHHSTAQFYDKKQHSSVSRLTLSPFELAIVSVHVKCTNDMRFETDFLSRAVTVGLPVTWHGDDNINNNNNNKQGCQSDVDIVKETKNNNTNDFRQSKFVVARAYFMDEKDVWEHYTELPGGCLTLTDQSQLQSVF